MKRLDERLPLWFRRLIPLVDGLSNHWQTAPQLKRYHCRSGGRYANGWVEDRGHWVWSNTPAGGPHLASKYYAKGQVLLRKDGCWNLTACCDLPSILDQIISCDWNEVDSFGIHIISLYWPRPVTSEPILLKFSTNKLLIFTSKCDRKDQ